MSENDSKFFDVDEKDIFKFTKEFPTGSGEEFLIIFIYA